MSRLSDFKQSPEFKQIVNEIFDLLESKNLTIEQAREVTMSASIKIGVDRKAWEALVQAPFKRKREE